MTHELNHHPDRLRWNLRYRRRIPDFAPHPLVAEALAAGAGRARRVRGRTVRADATFASDPEAVRDAKGTLSALMVESYKETLHQAAFAAALDIDHARQLGSFTHLVRCVGRLIDAYHSA